MARSDSSGRQSGDPESIELNIPDYTLLKEIGRGSYGEVWMARSLTGALRALKIVRRSDFDGDSAFRREFRGIQSYEEVSRSHPALLEVLHVGHLSEPELYYYVMELADPDPGAAARADDNVAQYAPHTLASELSRRRRLTPRTCVEVAVSLSEALAVLHEKGLVHRDVKPSNVIYVSGRPKLADLGLVATGGQRTFVGTEGYVPPEGPGSPQGDLYSLGKILYEMATGCDRLEFPGVPDDLDAVEDKAAWRELNRIACKACAPEPKRRCKSALEMKTALSHVPLEGSDSRAARSRLLSRLAVLAAVAAILALVLTVNRNPTPADREEISLPAEPQPDEPLERTTIKVVSSPPGASVYRGEEFLGTTPLMLEGEIGQTATFTLVQPGYRTVTVSGVPAPDQRLVLGDELEIWRPPTAGKRWANSAGVEFIPVNEIHVSSSPVTLKTFADYDERAVETGDPKAPALVDTAVAAGFCDWLTRKERDEGYLEDIQRYRPATREEVAAAGVRATTIAEDTASGTLHLVAETAPHGNVQLLSNPDGALVFLDSRRIGKTPLDLTKVPAGKVSYRLEKPGFDPVDLVGILESGKTLFLKADLVRNGALIFGEQWENSLGMRFVPLGDIMFSVWETRVSDFAVFAASSPELHHDPADFDQDGNHPVVRVTRSEAEQFCDWLTRRERENGLLPPPWYYRLPTDVEWSVAAGLAEERGATPAARDGATPGLFPWGDTWPPPDDCANLADVALRTGVPSLPTLKRFHDGFVHTAPVGSFPANEYDLHDLAGNVWEWVRDSYGGSGTFTDWAVLRGGSWANSRAEVLWVSYRNLVKPDLRETIIGFRCVIAKEED